MTYDEAAAVTSIGTAFRGSNIFTFNELEFFYGLRQIGEYAFSGCNSLRELIIPEGVTRIEAFLIYNSNNIETLVLPSTLTYLGHMGATNCFKLKYVYIYATQAPPVGNSNFFFSMGNLEGRIVYVPANATGYDTNRGWQAALEYGFVFSYTL